MNWFKNIFPYLGTVDRIEKLRACAGVLFGLVLTGIASYEFIGNNLSAVFFIAPMGASAYILFALPASPLAQPWSLLGGNMVAALVGVTCQKLIGEPLLAAAIAGSLSLALMFKLKCLHPPSGAVALTAILGGPVIHGMGYKFVVFPVLVNSIILLLTALFFNNSTGRRYPQALVKSQINPNETRDKLPLDRLGISTEDLDAVLGRYNQILDISRSDLEDILLETERQAFLRRFGITQCVDIMSKDVLSVEFSTDLQTAWDLLNQSKIVALPVIDRARRVIGLLTQDDFIRQTDLKNYSRFQKNLNRLLKPILRSHSKKPEVVGQIMQKDVFVALENQAIIELVQKMAEGGLHSVPVVDENQKLLGMIAQSDMIAALFEISLRQASKV